MECSTAQFKSIWNVAIALVVPEKARVFLVYVWWIDWLGVDNVKKNELAFELQRIK